MFATAAIAFLTMVAMSVIGNRFVFDFVPVHDQPLEPLRTDITRFASRNRFIERISVDPMASEIRMFVRAKDVGRARAALNHWLDERNAEKILSRSKSGLIQKLFGAEIVAGSSVESVSVEHETAIMELGRYTQFQYPSEIEEAVLTLTVREGIILSANVDHLNWHWTFFDVVPATHTEKIHEVQEVRKYIQENPSAASELKPHIEQLLLQLK